MNHSGLFSASRIRIGKVYVSDDLIRALRLSGVVG